MSYKLAIFDLDGTVLDTLEDLFNSCNVALEACGYPLRTFEEIRSFVGNGIRNLMERIVPVGTPVAEIDRVHAAFMAHYTVYSADKTAPYAGVLQLLADLRAAGVKTAVVSNKAHAATVPLCGHYFSGLFDVIAGERESEGIPKKPAPDGVFDILRTLGMAAADAVYIGDSEVDVATARNAGLDGIFVTWGFRTVEQLREAGATTIVDTTDDVKRCVLL